MTDFFWFSDCQWARIEPLLPVNGKSAKRACDRRILSGIVHALQSGGRWSDCPPVCGTKKTLYSWCVRWAERGIPPVDRIFSQASAGGVNLRTIGRGAAITRVQDRINQSLGPVYLTLKTKSTLL